MITIDITPMAINSTAMYHVVRDSVKYILSNICDNNVRLIAAGEPIDSHLFVLNDFSLNDAESHLVSVRVHEGLGDGFYLQKNIDSAPRDFNDILIVFDLLYLLYYPRYSKTIAYVLDSTPLTKPEWHNAHVAKAYKHAFERLYDKAILIVAISESTRNDIWSNLGISLDRIFVIPLYNRHIGSNNITRNVNKQILFVGSLEERKNIRNMLLGFRDSLIYQQGYTLRLVGGDGYGSEQIRQLGSSIDGIEFVGKISDYELEIEYSKSCMLFYISYWEGFGLPILEALSRGIPVLLSNTGAMPEVGSDFAEYVDPCNSLSIIGGIKKIVRKFEAGSYSKEYAESAISWANNFSLNSYLSNLSCFMEENTGCQFIDKKPSNSYKITNEKIGNIILKGNQGIRNVSVPRLDPNIGLDSFSLDYLYLLQQNARIVYSKARMEYDESVNLSRVKKAIHLYLASKCFKRDTMMIQSLCNEIILMKLRGDSEHE